MTLDLNDLFPADTVNTEVVFACGKMMILKSDHGLNEQEIAAVAKYTAEEFKAILLATKRFTEVPFGHC